MILSIPSRSSTKELLDRVDIPFKDIERNMYELEFINKHLGGHSITIAGVKHFCKNNQIGSIAEIGSGGGDNLLAIHRWANGHHLKADLTGIDINSACVEYARSRSSSANINFIHCDYREVVFSTKPDVIFSSLFTHHFTNPELVEMLIWMKNNSGVGFFINDLHRHPLAYHSIKLLSTVFSKSYLVKNDAPLSVLRSFTRKDWTHLFKEANIPLNHCTWKWAFRWLVISCNDNKI